MEHDSEKMSKCWMSETISILKFWNLNILNFEIYLVFEI